MWNGNQHFKFRFHPRWKIFDLLIHRKLKSLHLFHKERRIEFCIHILQYRDNILYFQVAAETGVGQYNPQILFIFCREIFDIFAKYGNVPAIRRDQP